MLPVVGLLVLHQVQGDDAADEAILADAAVPRQRFVAVAVGTWAQFALASQ